MAQQWGMHATESTGLCLQDVDFQAYKEVMREAKDKSQRGQAQV